MYASILRKGEQVTHTFGSRRVGYIHVPDTGGSVRIDDVILSSGDGAYITNKEVEIVGEEKQSEFVLFDMK